MISFRERWCLELITYFAPKWPTIELASLVITPGVNLSDQINKEKIRNQSVNMQRKSPTPIPNLPSRWYVNIYCPIPDQTILAQTHNRLAQSHKDSQHIWYLKSVQKRTRHDKPSLIRCPPWTPQGVQTDRHQVTGFCNISIWTSWTTAKIYKDLQRSNIIS